MAVPNTFAAATSAIPLANLDANFAYYDAAYSITGTATSFTGAVTLSTGTANGVPYLNASKVLTSGSVLTFNGTILSSTRFAGALNGTVGATTPAAGSFTNITGSANAIISVTDNTNAALRITQLGTGDALLVEDSTNPDASPFVITNNGTVVAGYTSRVTSVNVIEAHSASGVNSAPAIGVYGWGTLATGGGLNLYKSRSGTVGTYSLVANGTQSSVRFQFDDGAAFQQAASIIGSAEGTPALNSMPGRLTFATTADGSVTPTERMRIASNGDITIAGGTANGVAYLNGSKVLTTGSALTFDGTRLTVNAGAGNIQVGVSGDTSYHYSRLVDNGGQGFYFGIDNSAGSFFGAGAYGRSIYSEGSYPIQFVINSSEAMRLTSTGLGIGTSSPGAKLHVSTGTTTNALAGNAVAGFTSGGNAVISFNVPDANAAGLFFGYGGNAYWAGMERDGAAGLRFVVAGNEMRIDSSGNLGLGVNPSAWFGNRKAFQVGLGGSIAGAANYFTELRSNSYLDSGAVERYISSNAASYYYLGGGTHAWFRSTSTPVIGNDPVFSQAMTLDASGNLFVGTTSSSPNPGLFVSPLGYMTLGNNAQASGFAFVSFDRSGTNIGSITQNGTTAVAYNTGSDYRLKNITGPITTSGAYIDSLKPVEGTWKADGSTFVGLIAHETQEVSRTTVATGTKDGEQMQGMDYSSAEIIANLIAELQSVRTRLAALEAK